jgi:plastocyanin/methionine-rich copper-binding protein CopC
MKKIVVAMIIGAVIGMTGFLIWRNVNAPQGPEVATPMEDQYAFDRPKKSAHYESNTPEHEAVLPAAPINIVIDFNFDLAKPSEIKIIKDAPPSGEASKDYGIGETTIDANKLALRRAIDPAAPEGLYKVEYKACWPDGSCHVGHFQFAIDSAVLKAGEYFDLRGKKEVLITMDHITFNPRVIIIDKGTKVFWKNTDPVEHYVNTDGHPAHTYFPAQNSQALKQGEVFSLVFDKAGAYPYHCSAHAENMKGLIIVK